MPTYDIGVDVSHWQGKMNWVTAKNRGISFAMLKITEGNSYFDDKFVYNHTKCLDLGIDVGYYHFVRTDISAEQQFKWLKSKLPTITNTKIALDCEEHPNNQDSITTTDVIASMSNMIADLVGQRPIIYTSAGYANYKLLPWKEWKSHQLWIASWTDAAKPILPKYWDEWYMWQFGIYKPGSFYGASSTGIDVNRRHQIVVPEPPAPPSDEVVANVQVQINGITYAGTATLKQV